MVVYSAVYSEGMLAEQMAGAMVEMTALKLGDQLAGNMVVMWG